jgi:very-short-patch-repair endonuclease
LGHCHAHPREVKNEDNIMPNPVELISSSFRINFREFCVGLYVGQIKDIFRMANILPKSGYVAHVNGERRSTVEEHYASLDWSNTDDVERFLKAVGLIFSQTRVSDEQKSELKLICESEGLIIDGYLVCLGKTQYGNIKNLIFAANGPKPEMVLEDAIKNNIRIVKNAEYCLVYEEPILQHGLRWYELRNWWAKRIGMQGLQTREIADDLYKRLKSSLINSNPEELLMHTYFVNFYAQLGEDLPALIPQVYFHYDPYTLKQLNNRRRIPRQRMDFLLLLPRNIRIVLEIDGKHHYSIQNDKADPVRYAEMVQEDRKLKMAGYEVYRFGGQEFVESRQSKEMIQNFFSELFSRYLH